MKNRPVFRHEAAENDVQGIVDYYFGEGLQETAVHFSDALEQTINKIGSHPALGSPRYAHELGIEGLRFRLIPRFPFLVFYVVGEDYIEVWRILHTKRDIPATLQE
jgi:toxin ParE1/3/4